MIKPLFLAIASLCVIGFCWFYYSASTQQQILMSLQLRESMVSLQNAQQREQILDSDHAHPLLSVLGEELADLQIRLSESMSQSKASGEPLITAYEQLVLPGSIAGDAVQGLVGQTISDVNILRLDTQSSVEHASQFLMLLTHLGKATGGWPSEVLGCDILRMPSQNLSVRCIVDIYYWSVDIDS